MRNVTTRHDVVTLSGIIVNVVIRCAVGVEHRTSQDGSEAYLLSWSKVTEGSFTKGKSGRQVKLRSDVKNNGTINLRSWIAKVQVCLFCGRVV
jgi:hypothetical protein